MISASVIIPAHNQYEPLCLVLKGFFQQTASPDDFELIIVDDGSQDQTSNLCVERLSDKPKQLRVAIFHTLQKGRAGARNFGASKAKGKVLIFCDSDRVPHPAFVTEHLKMHGNGATVVVGHAFDYYGMKMPLAQHNDWNQIETFSKLPPYYKQIFTLYNGMETCSKLAWLSFLVGNASVCSHVFQQLGGFNEQFKEWGFEHFEFGYRLQQSVNTFYMNENARNYHIPHKRSKGFYQTMVEKNAEIMSALHPEINCAYLQEFLLHWQEPHQYELLIYNGRKNNE